MGNPNFKVSVDLHDANVIRRALSERLANLREASKAAGQTNNEEWRAAGAEAMDIERIIRINFPE